MDERATQYLRLDSWLFWTKCVSPFYSQFAIQYTMKSTIHNAVFSPMSSSSNYLPYEIIRRFGLTVELTLYCTAVAIGAYQPRCLYTRQTHKFAPNLPTLAPTVSRTLPRDSVADPTVSWSEVTDWLTDDDNDVNAFVKNMALTVCQVALSVFPVALTVCPEKSYHKEEKEWRVFLS